MAIFTLEQVLAFRPLGHSLSHQVLAFFFANPEEELSSADVAQKWAVESAGMVSGKLGVLRDRGLLAGVPEPVPGGGHAQVIWRVGPNFTAWADQAKGDAALAALLARPAARGGVAGAAGASGAASTVVTPVGAIEIRVTLHVYGAGTPFQRVELAGVEP